MCDDLGSLEVGGDVRRLGMGCEAIWSSILVDTSLESIWARLNVGWIAIGAVDTVFNNLDTQLPRLLITLTELLHQRVVLQITLLQQVLITDHVHIVVEGQWL